MTIAVFEHDDTHAAQLNQILGESGYLDAHSAKHLDQLRDTLGMTPQSSEPAAGSNMRVHVSLLILSVDQGESALDFLRQLKSDVRYKDIPVVVTSESGFDQNIRTAYAYGASDYIRKPFHSAETKARIHASLRLNHEIDRRKARENEITEIANQLRDLTQVLMKLSLIDPLTGVANRRSFDQNAEQEFKRARRNKKPFSIVLFDVDHFKLYNDHYGHQQGDQCLVKVAQTLQEVAQNRGDGMMARYGGEEFVGLFKVTDQDAAMQLAQELVKHVNALGLPHAKSSTHVSVSISLGLCFSEPGSTRPLSALIKQADDQLYQSKTTGRNRASLSAFIATGQP